MAPIQSVCSTVLLTIQVWHVVNALLYETLNECLKRGHIWIFRCIKMNNRWKTRAWFWCNCYFCIFWTNSTTFNCQFWWLNPIVIVSNATNYNIWFFWILKQKKMHIICLYAMNSNGLTNDYTKRKWKKMKKIDNS